MKTTIVEMRRCDEIAREATSNKEAFEKLIDYDLTFAVGSLKRIRGLTNAQIIALAKEWSLENTKG